MTLALKLFLTPCLIAAATLVGRQWGAGVSGWLIGYPLTSGPVSLILASQYGKEFAARAAIGTLGGQASVCVFCLIYSWSAQKWTWPVCAGLAVLAFLASIIVWNSFTLSLLPTFFILILMIAVFAQLIPRRPAPKTAVKLPRWDLPARMIIATLFVVGLTSFAMRLGPQLSGLLAPFPVFALVLAVFAHRQQGADAAIRLLRGNVIGSLAFAFFFLVVGAFLTSLAILLTYIIATLAAILVNGISLRLVR